MTASPRSDRRPLAARSTLLLALLAGCSDDGDSSATAGAGGAAATSGASGQSGQGGSAGRGGNGGSAGASAGSSPGGSAGSSQAAGGKAGGSQAGSSQAGGQAGSNQAGQAGSGQAGSGQAGGQAGGAAGQGGGGSSGASGQAGSALVPLFVAQGHLGRTTVSCDDGLTWIADRSDVPDKQCYAENNEPNCDHTSGAGRGLAWGEGYFFATFGWGEPGSIRRSVDGFTWEQVLTGTTFAGVSFAGGTLVAGSGQPRWSSDLGANWSAPVDTKIDIGARRSGAAEVPGGTRFLLIDDGNKAALSSDGGKTWWKPDTFPEGCGQDIQWEGGVVGGNGVLVVMGGTGLACRSTDGGKTWTATALGETIGTRLLWTGSEFMVWTSEKRYRSPDGASWTSEKLTTPRQLSAIARSPGGTFVSVRGGWMNWYDKQEFYRSTDGLTWEVLPASAYTKSHPISFIVSGQGVCPTP